MSHEAADRDSDIMQVLFARLAKFPVKSGELTAQTSLVGDMSLDSVNIMELLMELEDIYDVSLPLNRMADVTTVQELADQIRQRIEDQS